jgi:hypothetical protein
MGKKANLDNLKTPRSTDEAREWGKKGGKKSGEIRAQKKSLRTTMEVLLELQVTPGNKTVLQTMGIDENDQSNRMLLAVGLMKKAISGDVSAFNSIRDLVGEKPKERIGIGADDDLEEIRISFTKPKVDKTKDPAIVGEYTPKTDTTEKE